MNTEIKSYNRTDLIDFDNPGNALNRGFNPENECRYLSRLQGNEVQQTVLAREITTAINEAYLISFNREYVFRDGRLFDSESGEFVDDLTKRGNRKEEIEAIEKVQNLLKMGNKLVVNFSPKIEEYDYPASCVDFWWKKDEEARWLRVEVNNNWQELREVYQLLGGEKIVAGEKELLSNPVGSKLANISEVLSLMEVTQEIHKIDDQEIETVVKRLMTDFQNKFGGELTKQPDIIFRLFSAAMAETTRIEAQLQDCIDEEVDINEFLDEAPYDLYLESMMRSVEMGTSGCASVNMVGEFIQGTSHYLLYTGGSYLLVNGEPPEGYKLCAKCGLWYKGDSCPVCD